MGQCYNIYLKLKSRDENASVKALQEFITENNINTIGLSTNNLENLLKIVFGNSQGTLHLRHTQKNGFKRYESDFNASYSWEGLLMDAFSELASTLEDGSRIDIYPDYGRDTAVVRDSRADWVN